MPNRIAEKWTKVVQAPARAGNRVDYLVDGWATFQRMYDAIQTTLRGNSSSYFIYLLAWWLDDDLPLNWPPVGRADEPGATKFLNRADPTSSFFRLVKEASERGVEVRVLLYDNLFYFLTGKTLRSLATRISNLPAAVVVIDGNLRLQSHHQKLLVVNGSDGLIGFCGGIDISWDRVGPVRFHPPAGFHDVHCRIQGEATFDLLGVFAQRWSESTRLATTASFYAGGAKVKRLDDPLKRLRSTSQVSSACRDEGEQHVAVLRTFLPSPGKCIKEASIGSTLLGAIRTASKFIYIEDQYMVYAAARERRDDKEYRDVATALGERLNDLKHVTILIPHSAISDLPNRWEARLEFMETLLRKAGKTEYWRAINAVRLQTSGAIIRPPYPKLRVFFKYEKPTGKPPLDRSGSKFPKYIEEDFGPGSYVHSKMWIFDDELAIVGSANCNRRGWNYDSEASVAIFDRAPGDKPGQYSFAQQLRIQLWKKHLRLPETDPRIVNGADPGDSWFTLKARQFVRLYNPNENTDDYPTQRKIGRGAKCFADPDGSKEKYKSCGG